LSGHNQLGFQGKLSYEWKGSVPGKVWISGMTQQAKANSGDFAPVGAKVRGEAGDIGVKAGAAGFEGVVAVYTANGIGTTAIGFDAASFANGSLEKRKSNGAYAQGTYKFGQIKLGLSYGESRLDRAGNEEGVPSSNNLVKKNKSWIPGIYYSLTEALTLTGEYVRTEAENHGGGKIKDDAWIVGAILFF